MDTYNRSIIGLKSRSNGEYFERMIMAASRFYEDRGIAVIDKTPEAFKVIKPYNRDRGQFICCFTQQAQPDFVTPLAGVWIEMLNTQTEQH